MDKSRTLVRSLALLGAAAMIAVALPVSAQVGSPGASQDPAASEAPADGVRVGWTLHTSAVPAFSIQLPPGWAIDPATDGLLGATGPDGETLVARLDESVAGESLEIYTKRSWDSVEKDVKALLSDGHNVAGGAPTEPTYRQAAGGLVARVGVARSADEVGASHVTARFLTAPCDDGARTFEIAGPAPEPGPGGAPDLWDRIAASISPCSSEPMPELVLDPALSELGAAYWATAQAFNPKIFAAVDELNKVGSFKKWAKDSVRIADVYDEFRQHLLALPWTTETRPLAEAQAAEFRGLSDFFRKKEARATTNRALDSLDKQLGLLYDSLGDAVDATRLAIGLPITLRT